MSHLYTVNPVYIDNLLCLCYNEGMENIIRTDPESVKKTFTYLEGMLANAAFRIETQQESAFSINLGGLMDESTVKSAIKSDTVYNDNGEEMPDLYRKLLDNNNDVDYGYYYDQSDDTSDGNPTSPF